jgi:hypothetical protein
MTSFEGEDENAYKQCIPCDYVVQIKSTPDLELETPLYSNGTQMSELRNLGGQSFTTLMLH